MTSRSKHLGIALCLISCLPIEAQAQGDLDDGHREVGADTVPIAYDLSVLVEHVREVYGDSDANELAGDLADPPGTIKVGEIFTPAQLPGSHDENTILINTRGMDGKVIMTSFEAAMVLYHEYTHVKNARNAQQRHDPTTRGDCGSCVHADRHFKQAMAISNVKCPTNYGDDAVAVHRAMRNENAAGEIHFAKCDSVACETAHADAASSRALALRMEIHCQ